MTATETPFDDIRRLITSLPGPDRDAVAMVAERDATLTKPAGSLGRLEHLVSWLAAWQGKGQPTLDRPLVCVFAGSHGVAARGVSAYPTEVNRQMLDNFAAGGGAINQICAAYGLGFKVFDLAIDLPTGDITTGPAFDEKACVATMAFGMEAVAAGTDCLALGEMGIGNTTVAAAIYAALYGGEAAHWVGRGTGVDEAGFARKVAAVEAALAHHAGHLDDPQPPAFYIGSTDLDTYLPGLRRDNDLALPPPPPGHAAPLASIWIGNRTIAATHYDLSNNLAVCLVGRRRFTLFPPDQVANLYPGPLEPTPGGQVVSMVDLRAPDLDRYPRFAEALANAQVADLEPGDVLFYPALWWHNVEALGRFNVMINYWWNDAPAFADSPMTTLLHAMLSLRERPAAERAAWAAMFDHYIWRGGGDARDHLPPEIQGDLAPLDPMAARRLRAKLLQRLNR